MHGAANAPMSYMADMSPLTNNVVVLRTDEAPIAVDVHPSMPLTPRLQSLLETCIDGNSWAYLTPVPLDR